MLPKSRKIARQSFPKDLRAGVRRTSTHFSLFVCPAVVGKQSIFSVVVSGKVAKRAVVRNKIRRRVYSIIRAVSPNIASGQKIIVFARAGSHDLSYSATATEIKELLTAARLTTFP